MFESVDDIYNYIGQAAFNALPDEWHSAQIDVLMYNAVAPRRSLSVIQQYCLTDNGTPSDFDTDEVDGEVIDSNVSEAFYALYDLMKTETHKIPWNKTRFFLTSEGDFEIDFKLDEDYEWYKALSVDSQEYDELDIDIINQIKTWEGLPEGAPRSWRN